MEKHIHELQFVEKGGLQCSTLGCDVYYSEEQILEIIQAMANKINTPCSECGAESEDTHYRECSVG